jgi:hypothetical protein
MADSAVSAIGVFGEPFSTVPVCTAPLDSTFPRERDYLSAGKRAITGSRGTPET